MAIEVQGVAPLVQVFDMTRSIRFYRDLLGFTITEMSKAKSADPDDVGWAMLQLSNATIMLNTAQLIRTSVPVAPDAGRWSGHPGHLSLLSAVPMWTVLISTSLRRALRLVRLWWRWYGIEAALSERPRRIRYLLPVRSPDELTSEEGR